MVVPISGGSTLGVNTTVAAAVAVASAGANVAGVVSARLLETAVPAPGEQPASNSKRQL
jgi:hypothetical protein